MGRRMGFPYLFRRAAPPPSSYPPSSWAWPSCKHPRTRSFRGSGAAAAGEGIGGSGEGRDEVYKTVNSVYLDTTESWFTNSSEELASESFSTASEADSGGGGGEPEAEAVIRAVQSERGGGRLFFEPGGTSSILEESKSGGFPFKDGVVLAMESKDPYSDFRLSMEEMVTIYGVRDWQCLEELLEWYLRVNGKTNHRFIVGAFVDLLLDLFAPPSSSSSSRSLPFEADDKDQENGS
ncbi:unnamed protein product [Spirodela intermedia]|uniref:Transcription repressor n=1 Tax=Spirodela intermedia TaxID=51605 RepID=A0A7I8KIR2_SPIIN|nr:unnamed protein product [Spirodela intermedia]